MRKIVLIQCYIFKRRRYAVGSEAIDVYVLRRTEDPDGVVRGEDERRRRRREYGVVGSSPSAFSGGVALFLVGVLMAA